MVAPIKLDRTSIDRNPHAVWNAFVEIAHSPPDDLDAVPRVAHHAFRYLGEVNNDGHLQYTENRGT
ncbi:MAG: hypothetical protein HOP29_19870 [Phycisphaerales bacterium]|nr:hypothetical protein [Phycisphaerales bacterium]